MVLRGRKTLWIGSVIALIGLTTLISATALSFAVSRYVASRRAQSIPTATLAPTAALPEVEPPSPAPTATDATAQPTSTPAADLDPTPAPGATASPLPIPTPQGCSTEPFAYGESFGGRALLAYQCGNGPIARAIIGGIHGGYEWNTVVLISETLKYLWANPEMIPADLTLYVIPCANPDGYAAGTDVERGRVNGNDVDLNRNWEYEWQPEATHGSRPVSAGSAPFSEPETQALRDLILTRNIEAVIFYHSAMARVFQGAETELSLTDELAAVISEATGYAVGTYVPGQITTGDSIDWMSAEGLAGVEVELTNHQDLDWERNLRGLEAFLKWMLPAQPTSAEDSGSEYVVQEGDTLSEIAEELGVDVDELMRLNGITDPDAIQIGQRLRVPVR